MAFRNKFNAVKTRVGEYLFHSKREAQFYQALLAEKANGSIVEIICQPMFILQPAFEKHGEKHRKISYKADFFVRYKDGSSVIFEVKGFKTEGYRIRRKLFDFKYTDLKFVEVS